MKTNAPIVKILMTVYLAGCHSHIVPENNPGSKGKVVLMGLPSPSSSREYVYSTTQRRLGLLILSANQDPLEAVFATDVAILDGKLTSGEWTLVRFRSEASLLPAVNLVYQLRNGELEVDIDDPKVAEPSPMQDVDVPPSGIPRMSGREIAISCLESLKGDGMPVWIVVTDGEYRMGCRIPSETRRSEAVLRIKAEGGAYTVLDAEISDNDTIDRVR